MRIAPTLAAAVALALPATASAADYSYRTIATGDGANVFLGQCPALNNLGQVAFTGELNDALSDQGLFEGSGGPVATRYLASTSQFSGSISPPSLNDLEQAAFGERT